MSDIRAAALQAFTELLDGERTRAAPRLEAAAMEGFSRDAYARERRITDARAALSVVSEGKWQDLSDWLLRFGGSFEVQPIRGRPRFAPALLTWLGSTGLGAHAPALYVMAAAGVSLVAVLALPKPYPTS